MLRAVLLYTIIICSSLQKIQNLNDKVSLKAQLGSWEKEGSNFLLDVKVKFINNTGDTLTYTNMSCATFTFYILNTDKLKINDWECDGNYPVSIKIPPYGIDEEILKLNRADRIKKVEFKIGFYFIEPSFKIFNFSRDKLSYTNNIIWSENLKIE
jgi:hypothetical protein